MGVTNSNKSLSVSRIDCGGSFSVTLSLTAAPDIVSNPTDIVLILDRSASMAGSALANLKNDAKAFIDIIDESTDGAQDGQIGGGSRIGIVSFASTATQDTQLITSVADLKAAEDAVEFDAGSLALESLGRIVQLDVTLRNICPNRRVALAVALTEVDEHGLEHKRGLKTITVPAHTRTGCRDVTVRCIKFILPEDLDVSGGSEGAICNLRHFKARLFAHYIDHDFACCDLVQ